MGSGISSRAVPTFENKYKSVVTRPIVVKTGIKLSNQGDGSNTKGKEDESTFSGHTVPSLETLQRSDSILFDPSTKFDNLLPDLIDIGAIFRDSKVVTLFYRFLKETNWMDELLQSALISQESNKSSQKHIGNNNSISKPYAVHFHQYLLTTERHHRSLMQHDDMEAQALYLLHTLKNREAREDLEQDGKEETLLDHLSKEAIISMVAAMGLRYFVVSPEYKNMASCNWAADPMSIKFKRIDSMAKSSHNLRKFKSGNHFSRMNSTVNNIPTILSSRDTDPIRRQKNLIEEMLFRMDANTFHVVLGTQEWLSPLASAIHQLPIALTVSSHDNVCNQWNIEYATPSYAKLTGYPIAEVVGRDMSHLQWEHGDPDHKLFVQTSLKHREPCKIALNHKRKTGDVFVDFVALQPIFDHDIALVSSINSMNNVHPSPSIALATAAATAMGAAVSSTSAFFSQQSSSSVMVQPFGDVNEDKSADNQVIDLENLDIPSHPPIRKPSNNSSFTGNVSGKGKRPEVPRLMIPTPTYQKLHRVNNIHRRCRRYVNVHTDVEAAHVKIANLKLVDDLMLILQFIM